VFFCLVLLALLHSSMQHSQRSSLGSSKLILTSLKLLLLLLLLLCLALLLLL
jgi:hypothetical protein